MGLASSAQTPPPEQVLEVADEAMHENKKVWYEDNNIDAARSPGLGEGRPYGFYFPTESTEDTDTV